MKRISCRDLGGMDCAFVAEGETAEQVKERMWAHAAQDHGEMLAGMSEAEKTAAAQRLDELLGQ